MYLTWEPGENGPEGFYRKLGFQLTGEKSGGQTVGVLELARQQGVKPLDFDELLQADFWPEEESTDEFLATLREWRREGVPESRP